MSILVRRSNLVIPATQLRMIRWGWRHNADAVTIDLQDGVPRGELERARKALRQFVVHVSKGGADVFVRVNARYAYADTAAAVCPELTGILLPGVECAAQVAEADDILTELERKRGVARGTLELAPAIETAAGVWHIREIITASDRIKQVGIDEANLAASLGITQSAEYDPFVYARGRICIEATAAGVQAVAVTDPMGLGNDHLTHEDMLMIATDTRNLGFKGMVCAHPRWTNAINEAYTPTNSLVEYYTQVREVFAQALAAGTAAVPFAGRMIDVPVDEWAKDVLAMSAACAARDAEKRSARAAADAWSQLPIPVIE
jgi:citrate lyase subunit beta/citryl-CoA lyase